MKNAILAMCCIGCLGFTSCVSALKSETSGIADPTERGLMYVALAVIVGAFIRGIMNK